MATYEKYLALLKPIYARNLSEGISNQSLRSYFDNAFQTVVVVYELHPSWTCINCLRRDEATIGWGKKPRKCHKCKRPTTYSIASFQSRSKRFGDIFVVALQHLVLAQYQFELRRTPGNTQTHDLEVTPKVAIEAKGSARSILLPDGSNYKLSSPGMMRNDTEKKAFDNARNFMGSNPEGAFFVVTNALPPRLVGHRGDNVNGIFDVTKKDQLDSFVREAKDAS